LEPFDGGGEGMSDEMEGGVGVNLGGSGGRVWTRREMIASGFVALLPPFWGCSSDPTGPASAGSSPFMTVTWRPPTLSAVVGETPLGLEDERDGLLYVPSSYDAAVPVPLFVALHGAGGRADNWKGLFDDCDARGMALLAIDARQVTWDRIRGSFGPDVRFLDRAMGHTFDRVNVDSSRIVLGGFSDGASYALSLGPANGTLFSRIIAFSAGFARPPEGRVGRPPIFVSHGTRDSILPVENAREVIVPTFRDEGYEVEYREFEGGHEVPPEIGSEALDWFLS
jgi:phospholipase/carboxylesterase